MKREFLSKHSGKFAAEFVFVEFHHLRGLGWKLEIKEMVKRKAIFQQSPQVTNQILSEPSSTLNQLFPQIQGSSYNIKAKLQCRYVEWMSQMMIILSPSIIYLNVKYRNTGVYPSFLSLYCCNRRRHREWMEIKKMKRKTVNSCITTVTMSRHMPLKLKWVSFFLELFCYQIGECFVLFSFHFFLPCLSVWMIPRVGIQDSLCR